MPPALTIIALIALLAGLLLVGLMLVGRRGATLRPERLDGAGRTTALATPLSLPGTPEREQRGVESTLRVAWWLTITIVLLGVGISGSFAADQAPIFLLGAGAVVAVVVLHEVIGHEDRGRLAHLVELVAATALIGGLLVVTGYASSPFSMLFALVAVAAALAHGPRAGLTAAALATAAFGAVLYVDPRLSSYGPEDALRLSTGLGATWLLAFVAIAYAGHQRRTVAQAVALSRTDPLTGLFNRSQLFVTLETEVSRTRRSDRGFCVLMIDLDGLKAINDSSGHLRGDEVLHALGNVIRSSIRTVDSAYRYGGDEFVVVLPETDIVGAFVVAEKVRLGAEELGRSLDGTEPMTSVSIGLVSHPEDGLSAEELMTAADRAMYQAKRLGKNQISGNPRPRPALLARRPAAEGAPAGDVEVVPATAAAVDDVEAPAAVAVEERLPGAADEEPSAPSDDVADVEPAAVEVRAPEPRAVPVDAGGAEAEEEPDPQEVRRQIATASQSFDPDHQIRRAMDAFLSPVGSEQDQPTRDH